MFVATVGAIFDHIWADGQDGQDLESLTALASKIGVADIQAATSAQSVKDTLRTNTEDAVANGIYGVPTFQIDGQIFWGDDMLDMMLEWLDDPTFLNDPESRRIMSLPPAAERKRGV